MPDQISFLDFRQPALPAGDYAISATTEIELDPEVFTASRTFTVGSDRHRLAPEDIRAVFPPPGSLGDHAAVLPHLVLSRATLPWERGELPWLALLLFTPEDRPEPRTTTAGALGVPLEGHESPDDQVTVIDVPRALLPDQADLPYLAHVRQGEEENAVLICERLPAPGATSTVHLVSLEGAYDKPEGLITLVTLHSWRFACLDPGQTFSYLVRDLARGGQTFRLPDTGEPRADAFLAQGFVPFPHRLRQGGDTVSWYRGPFLTGPAGESPELPPVRTSDGLLRFHPGVGMLETGYAAAWQLGRLLALAAPDFATALFDWKRARAKRRLRAEREPAEGYPLAVAEIDVTPPEPVVSWLTGLSRLHGVPFCYLVPDERLLPVETIRFLRLDQRWVHCLVDGAYSIGRLTPADALLDRESPVPVDSPPLSGALIRSDVITGYPGLLIDAYADQDGTRPLPLVRREIISGNILLCLFEGELQRLDLHQRPETLHFAVELPEAVGPPEPGELPETEGGEGTFTKALRDRDDPLTGTLAPFRKIPIADLAAQMAIAQGLPEIGSGAFALRMMESAERVTFLTPLFPEAGD
ncbi:hypothetical protein [Acrocarpospora catenulata]|uniref:hypothetical protein n=1 Tax=Acrocarpospora catenulata TaxID=2836182 RepID=UPI001BDA9BE9|nr:hypothetical protein [Acrocarpospora catenulata]